MSFPPARRSRAFPLLLGAVAVAFVLGPLPALVAGLDVLRDPGQAWSALSDPLLWRRTGSSLAIAAVVLAGALPIGLGLAWLLERTDVPLRRTWTALLLLSMFLPPLVHAISWASTWELSGRGAIVLVHGVVATPFVAVFALRSLASVSRARHDALRLLGGTLAVLAGELRHALPGALAGAALAATFVLADFATADFLTSVGPKVTVAADSVYAHHVGLRPAAAAAAGLPTAAIGLALLLAAFHDLARRGSSIGSRFEPAPRLALGRARASACATVAVFVAGASVLPFASLAYRAGSLRAVTDAAARHADAIGFTAVTAALAATLTVVLAAPILAFAPRRASPWLLLFGLVPLAASPLTSGIGLIRLWNQPELTWLYTGAGLVVLATAGRNLLIGALPIADGLARVDRGLIDSARLAGASRVGAAIRILLPLLRPSILVAWCLAFAFALREMDLFVMLRAGQSSLASRLYGNVVFARESELAALALVLAATCALPLLVLVAAGRDRRAWP